MKIKRYLLTGLTLAFLFFPSLAAFLKDVPQRLTQPDGTILNCLATGDERYNWLHDNQNFTIIQDPVTGYYVYAKKSGNKLVATTLIAGRTDPAAAGLQPGLNLDPSDVELLTKDLFKIPAFKGAASATTTGTINNIVIFIRFSDQSEFTSTVSSFSSAFNSSGSVSMMEYFREASKNQLIINTTLYPTTAGSTVVSYQDANPRNYFCKYNATTNTIGYQTTDESTTREMTLLKNATEAVKSQIEATGLDFDSDNNGYVDNVCYIVQGAVEAWNDLLWPHRWALYTDNVQISGSRVWDFNFQLSNSFGVSVLCHEMSHSIGFPDLYRYTNTSISPVGRWDIMGTISNPPQQQSAYNKNKYGQWFSGIPEITTGGTYTLAPLNTDANACYKIKSPNSTTEYFMVEYRQASGLFESGLPGSGLIISRVTPTLNGNSSGPPDEVYVYRPNGTATVSGDINSAYFSAESGRTTFNAASNPPCLLSDWTTSGGIEITNIGSAGSTISFKVNFGSSAPVLTVTPDTRSIVHTGGTTTFAVSNTGGGTMAWTSSVTTGATWVHITSGTSGSNTGTINVSVDANPLNSARTGVITIAAPGADASPKTVTVVQAPFLPVLSVLPASRSLDFTGGTTSFDIANSGGTPMNWTASVTTGSAWVHVTSGTPGTDGGSINVTVDPNTDNAIRTGVITVTAAGAAGSPKTVNITQAANPPVLSVTPDNQNIAFAGAATSFAVSNTGGGTMTWTASVTTGPAWAHIISGAGGSNSGTISVTVDANPDNAVRTGVITVTSAGAAGSPKTVNITQAANPPVLSVTPDNQNIAFAGAATSFAVSNTGGGTMVWAATVTSGSGWAHITSGAGGSNTGTISVTVDANPDNSVRTGVITVTAAGAAGSPKTVNITQAANPPVISVTPDNQNIAFTGATTSFAVSNTGGGTMVWAATVTSGSGWAHITSGAGGSNTGTISVTVDANPDNSVRTGVITVTAAGASGSPKTITITQAANPPILNVGPDNQNIAFTGAATSFAVSNTGGGTMVWAATVTSGSGWAHITSGAGGSNTGTISVTVDANPDNSVRTGVITVTSAGASGSPKTVTITQADNPSILNVGPDNQNIAFTGAATSFSVTNTGGGTMVWAATVTSGSGWAHITSGAGGSNTGTISVTVDANPDNSIRTGVITVTAAGASGSPKTVTITQADNPSILNVGPDNQNIAFTGAATSFAVTNTGGGTMVWAATVTSGSGWAHITSGAGGSNAGTISVTVDANPDNSVRTGVITVTSAGAAGSPKTVSITQAANPSILNVLPSSRSLDFAAGSSTFEITNSGGGTMVWTASVTTGPEWVHITSGASGSNAGTISVTVDANPDNAVRSGVITVTADGAAGSPKTVAINQAAKPAPKPDLSITRLTAITPSVTWPEKIKVSLTVVNNGECPSIATDIHFYISDTPSLDGVKADLGMIYCEPVNNGSDLVKEDQIAISESFLPGNYYLLAVVDNPSLNQELDESNNLAYCQISVLNDVPAESDNISFSVYPNPARTYLSIAFESNGIQVNKLVINNILGQVVYSDTKGSNGTLKTTIDVIAWKKGFYNVSLYAQNKVFHQIIILQ